MGLLSFFKALAVLWPFLKEIFLGNKKIRGALLRNKVSTTFVLGNVFVFLLFIYTLNEARTRETVIVEGKGQITALENALKEQKEQYERRIEAKDNETNALKDRVTAVVGRFDILIKQSERDSKVIDTLRQQVDILSNMQTRGGNTPPSTNARNAYLEQLEQLRKEEQQLQNER